MKKQLLLLGGGHSQVEVLRQFALRPVPNTDITLVSRDESSLYSGMLPGYIAGHYEKNECHIDLQPLARAAGASFTQAEVIGLDVEKKIVICASNNNLPYDCVAVNTGSLPALRSTKDADKYVIKVKPVSEFINKWEDLLQVLEQTSGSLNIAVVGGGAGGVELIMAMQYRAGKLLQAHSNKTPLINFHLFTDTPAILSTHNQKVQHKIQEVLDRRGVHVYVNKKVISVTPTGLQCEDNSEFNMDHVLWVTQAAAPEWVQNSNLAVDKYGFILVNDYLQSVSHPDVFAAGDIAALKDERCPKSGVIAVRQGPVLADNLHNYISGSPLRTFRPPENSLALISCGKKYAVASRGLLALEGRWLWTLKDWIDRRHIKKYSRFKTTG